MPKAKIYALTVLFVVGLAISTLPASGMSAGTIKRKLMAGAYALTITPPTVNGLPVYPDGSPVFLAGFGDPGSRPSTGVHDDIYARSLVLNDGEKTIVFVALDLIGYFIDQVEWVRTEVENEFGIEGDNVIVASTHTHAGPDTLGLWNWPMGVNWPYMYYIRTRIVECIDNALQNMQTARIKFASTSVPGLMKNSRDQLPKYAVTYPELEVMKVEDIRGGTIAVMINFAGHPEVTWGINQLISSDYVGYLRDYVEEELGGVAIFFNGALGGMVTPDVDGVFDGIETPGYEDQHTFGMAEEIGSRLASATIKALEDAKISSKIEINVEKEIITIPLENPAFYGGILYGILERPDPWYEFPPGGVDMGIMRTEVNVVQIGEAQMITMPGEVLPSIGHRLKRSMTGRYNFQIGLGNDELGYIIPEEEWDWTGNWTMETGEWDGKYEESMSVGPTTAIAMENTLTKMLSKVVAEGEGSVVVEDPEYSGPATLYIAGVISLKVVGWVPLYPWSMYPPPRPEEWKAPWVQWDIILHAILIVSGRRIECYLGYNGKLGYILIKISEGQVRASGPAVSFTGTVV